MKKKIIALILSFSIALPAQAFAAMETMPTVSQEMLAPSYWIKDDAQAQTILADSDTVRRLNASFLSCPDCKMNDLASAEGTYDGENANLRRWKATMSELSGFLDGKHYDEEGNILQGRSAFEILKNLEDPYASAEEEIQYGICVARTDVRAYPTDIIIADDPGDNDFDNVQIAGLRVGEPVTVLATSADGGYYYCNTTCVSGWIPSKDIALCKNKEEWFGAWDFAEDQVMVVTSSKVRLEESNTSPEISELMLTMGTVLEKVKPSEADGMITNRSLYYNYPVWIPVRNARGMYERRQALISAHHGVSDGFLPLTRENILTQAYEMLGDTYGWGGMLSSADCSSYVRDVYKCFGLELPRNTTWQSAMPVLKYDLSAADDDDKKELLNELPAGTILFIKGHEMIYLGHEDDNYYVISSSSSIYDQETEGKKRIRSVIINSLEERRVNGNTWLSELYEAAVPYVENEENVIIPVFSIKEERKVTEPAPEDTAAEASSEETGEEDGDEAEEEAVSLPYEEIAFDETWEYAGNSRIHDGIARLYRSDAEDRKEITICVNAGHGTSNGADYKTLCHPDGSPKIVSGSTAAGATEATAIAPFGVTMVTGELEAAATLKAAMVVKEELLKAGYDVLMIRETEDVPLDNIARTLIANNYADAHIALHYDYTDTDKGIFYCSVPDEESYKNMEPVKSCWELHEKLGKSLIYGLTEEGFAKWNSGALAMDLTQTSYSTIPSIDLEIGDTVTDYSYAALVRVAFGVTEGLNYFFDSYRVPASEEESDEALYGELESANSYDAILKRNGDVYYTITCYPKEGSEWTDYVYGDANRYISKDERGTLVIEPGEAYGWYAETDTPFRYLFVSDFDSFADAYYYTLCPDETETIVSQETENGQILLETSMTGELDDYFYAYYGYTSDEVDEIVTEYVIDEGTREILESRGYMVKDGERTLYLETILHKEAVKMVPDHQIMDGVFGGDERTVTVITDAGTEQEKTYTQTIRKGGRINVWTGPDFDSILYEDPACKMEIGETDNEADMTAYLKRAS
ncbi:MAG: SH3 domain-containing protein [Lachnospiraceae bacterium]|nr:SH3 domain-containing protein [Lachnospiraceae bacterium]